MFEFIPGWVLNGVSKLAANWSGLARFINKRAVNAIVNSCRTRPHPWSTVHDYVSWTSLTARKWSARHLPASDRPDADRPDPISLLEFFRRPDGEQRLSGKSTCLFPAFAQYLTDGFIRTRMPGEGEDPALRLQNTSNHEIDMSPLYGRTEAQINALRLMSGDAGKRGRLKSQMIGGEEYSPFLYGDDDRVKPEFKDLDPPLSLKKATPEKRKVLFAAGGDRVNAAPQIGMMNTLFLREHNRLAGEIEHRNPTWDDERVFETARNVVIVEFIKIVVEEYINHISPAPFKFIADPEVAWEAPWNKPNWITTEFSLLYRWHSLVPDQLQWSGASYGVGDAVLNMQPLIDSGLLQSFADMSAQAAGELGAFNTATDILPVEDAAIRQDRLCRLQSYGEYREYVGLSAPRRFEDVSSNPDIVTFLRSAYDTPKDIEYYIGMFAEDRVKNSPLPPLILKMVAIDAFSQALTNPLLSEHVYKESTFTKFGWETIAATGSLGDIVRRNVEGGDGSRFIGMTQPSWKQE